MSPTRSSLSSPWPVQTDGPSHVGKRKRIALDTRSRPPLLPRDGIANQTEIDEAKELCANTDNSQLSCWPTSETRLTQGDNTQFVWNSKYPSFAQFNLVDIALFRADTGEQVETFNNTENPSNQAGSLPVQVGDAWWGSNGADWDGSPTPFPFYFVIAANGSALNTAVPQATFTATQTTFASSVLASMSSASAASSSSAAAESSSLASLSSLSAASSSVTGEPNSASGGDVQGANDSSFPTWAIAVIVILGFFALAALIALIFLVISRARRRRYDPSRRGSLGSQSPMMANVQGDTAGPLSPQLESGPAASAAFGGAAAASSTSPENDGASEHSDNLFSGADAAVMAEAFRKALRKPEFADQPVEEGESPDAINDHPELLSRELMEEGRDIRSVGSSRGVRVETLSEGGEDFEGSTARDSTFRDSRG